MFNRPCERLRRFKLHEQSPYRTPEFKSGLSVHLRFGALPRICHGGWCPKVRLASDGRLAIRYRLRETESLNYQQRTKPSVEKSDAKLISIDQAAFFVSGEFVSRSKQYFSTRYHVAALAKTKPSDGVEMLKRAMCSRSNSSLMK